MLFPFYQGFMAKSFETWIEKEKMSKIYEKNNGSSKNLGPPSIRNQGEIFTKIEEESKNAIEMKYKEIEKSEKTKKEKTKESQIMINFLNQIKKYCLGKQSLFGKFINYNLDSYDMNKELYIRANKHRGRLQQSVLLNIYVLLNCI